MIVQSLALYEWFRMILRTTSSWRLPKSVVHPWIVFGEMHLLKLGARQDVEIMTARTYLAMRLK